MTYQVEFAKSAFKQFKALPAEVKSRIRPRLKALATEPRPPGVMKLKGTTNQYRIRIGNYRVIYAIEDAILVILVLKVSHRRDVYRA